MQIHHLEPFADSAGDSRQEQLERSFIAGNLSRRRFLQALAATGLTIAGLQARADELETIRTNQVQRAGQLRPSYDYIVVGTGSAGCALAGRLSERTDAAILLIEAGDWDTAPSVMNPGIWFTNLGTERDWKHVAVPTPYTNNRPIPEHMGRVVGGGSSINATIWVRPFKSDLDHWVAACGDSGWSYESALEIYRRMESWQGAPNPRYRGKNGPVWCQPANDPHPIAPGMLEACKSLGLPVFDDLNGEREERGSGFALMNQIIKNGQRNSLARAYLYPALARRNVTLLTNTQVDRLVLKGNKVVGVQVRRNGVVSQISASSEVILSAGAVNTPKLLMLSGIGDEKQLAGLGIKTTVHSPEVGRNFQDHLLHGGCLWEPNEHLPHRNSAANASGFWRTAGGSDSPDVNLVQIELPYTSDVVGKEFSPPPTSWALCAGLVMPKSRGTVTLRSTNPDDAPVVDAQFLSHPDDVKALSIGIEMARAIGNSAAMAPFVKREVIPAKKLAGQEMENFVRNGATTYFHASGTCRMGKDERAVVDSKLRVNGVQGLRVADSSIMPRIAAVATMATCALIGERMADILQPVKRG